MDKPAGSPSLAHPISTLVEAARDELVAEWPGWPGWPGESASPTCSAPTLGDLVAAGEVLPGYQPRCFEFVRVPDGWRRLRFIDEDFFRWPGDSKPEGYPEVGLNTARRNRKERERLGQPFDFDDAVRRIACHWLADWPGSVDFEDLRDWLVASFFTIAGGHQPPLVNGDTYRFIDRNTQLRAVRLDENVVGRCIEKAASSGVHHEALHKAGELILRRNRRLGGALSGWIADYMAGSLPRCRKRPAGENALRNRAIIAAVRRLEAEGMSATRGEESPPNSACDAIVKATNGRVTFEMAKSVWGKRER